MYILVWRHNLAYEKLQQEAEKADLLLKLRQRKQQELNGLSSEDSPEKAVEEFTMEIEESNQFGTDQNCMDYTKQEEQKTEEHNDGISCVAKEPQICAYVTEEIQCENKAIVAGIGEEEDLDKLNQSGEFLAESIKAEVVEVLKIEETDEFEDSKEIEPETEQTPPHNNKFSVTDWTPVHHKSESVDTSSSEADDGGEDTVFLGKTPKTKPNSAKKDQDPKKHIGQSSSSIAGTNPAAKFKCRVCSKTFVKQKDLNAHEIKFHLQSNVRIYHCKFCENLTLSLGCFVTHLHESHLSKGGTALGDLFSYYHCDGINCKHSYISQDLL